MNLIITKSYFILAVVPQLWQGTAAWRGVILSYIVSCHTSDGRLHRTSV
jgi:hypothetical protein